MSLIYTYSEDNIQLTLSDTDYEGYPSSIAAAANSFG